MAGVRDRNESAWLLPNDGSRVNYRQRSDMRRYADGDEVDLAVVGCGAGGSVLLQRLARRGWRVVGLDAGPFWDPDADWVSDEAGSHHLYWTEPRVIAGADPVPLGSNNSGRGEVRMYKVPPPEVSSEQFYETDPDKPYRRGFSIETVSPLPITWAEHVAAQGHWGQALREYMSDYVHWSCLGALCEFLPLPENRVTLAEEKDRYGLPVARRSFAGPNLFIADGSVLPTQGSANPALTIMAVAARAADHMAAEPMRGTD